MGHHTPPENSKPPGISFHLTWIYVQRTSISIPGKSYQKKSYSTSETDASTSTYYRWWILKGFHSAYYTESEEEICLFGSCMHVQKSVSLPPVIAILTRSDFRISILCTRTIVFWISDTGPDIYSCTLFLKQRRTYKMR